MTYPNFFPRKERTIDLTKPVRIYRNLNKKIGVDKVYSIKQKNKVVGYTTSFVLQDCKFVVNSAGWQTYIITNERNVHAYIEGYWGNTENILLSFSWILRYNLNRGYFSYKIGENESIYLSTARVVYTDNNTLKIQI
jgi:hypothetical protein